MTMVVGVNIGETSYEAATEQIQKWAKAGESRTVNPTGVHGVMEAYDSPDFAQTLNHADLNTPDGMPLVWMLRLKGCPKQNRVYGPTLMLHVLQMAEKQGIPVGFYGSNAITLQQLLRNMQQRFPELKVVYSFSPPFGKLAEDRSAEIIAEIKNSGVRVLFVGLGCPKQEYWVAEHKGKIPAVLMSVGAAFDFHAGNKSQAPAWMQNAGLEWLYRLVQEPRRLWRRYFYNNPRFIFLAGIDLLNYYRRR